KLVLAGQVYPFSYHRMYFESEVRPLIEARNSNVEFIEPPTFAEKVELLRCAKALLVTSLIAETSSLVSMEAGACGTPVVAFRSGALPEVVEHGRTGFLVADIPGMVRALREIEALDPAVCRREAEQRFSAATMISRYFDLYHQIAARAVHV